MLTSIVQDKPCVSVLNDTDPVTPEPSAHFHDWNIAELPPELLLQIARYLPSEDIWNLTLASRRVHSVLEESGVLEVARYYLSLPKNRQLFYQSLSINNPQLMHHLQPSKIKAIAHQTYCSENLPAICAYHAYHLHNETVNATSIGFALNKVIGTEDIISSYYLNSNHSRLIIKYRRNFQFSIWTAGNDGSWNKEFISERNCNFNCRDNFERYRGNTVFVRVHPHSLDSNCRVYNCGKDFFISIIERDESGFWSETQKITLDGLSPQFFGEHDFYFNTPSIKTSPDGKSLIFYSTKFARYVILGQELNGQWAFKGVCPWGYSQYFSPDSNHIAINCDKCVKFLGKQKDGSWSATGVLNLRLNPMDDLIKAEIEEGDLHVFDDLAFSPDSHHFVARFNNAGRDFRVRPINIENFFVMVTSLDDNGQWSETTRVIKHNPLSYSCTSLSATFSPDGKYLIVHDRHSFDIWHLTDDNSWSPVIKDHGYLQESKFDWFHSRVAFNTRSSVFLLLCEGSAMVWQLAGSGMWNCYHSFTYLDGFQDYCSVGNSIVPMEPELSADGRSIACTDGRGRLQFWVQDQNGKWMRQPLNTDLRIYLAVFNPEGDLLAGVSSEDASHLIMLGMTPNGTWREKGRLELEGRIHDFNFSHCGRSIMVSFMDRQQRKILTFWNIERMSDRQQSVD